MLSARAISKRFGATQALAAVDFEAAPGEVHALLGENGAGKTTLMRILAGGTRPDAGAVALDGAVIPPGSPRTALQAGIAAVHQSPMLFERLTVEENLALGGGTGARTARERAARLGFALPEPGMRVEECGFADRVRLELMIALSFATRVLILDEPTGVLAPSEVTAFLDLLRELRDEGRIVILITHKLAEALAIADRVTVLRRGRIVASLAGAMTTEAELARLMIGELPPLLAARSYARGGGRPALELIDLTLDERGRRILDRAALAVAPGEIVGIAGVEGNGQAELVEILAGVRRATGGAVRAAGPLAIIPQDRDLDGLVMTLAAWENLMLSRPLLARFSRCAWMRRAAAIEFAGGLMERFAIKPANPGLPAAALSGGNRQRLAVARALASEPRAIVAHNPCRGLDLAGAAEISQLLTEFAAGGGAVLLVSSDLDELLALATRIFVMSGGRLRALGAGERDSERLGILMAGKWD